MLTVVAVCVFQARAERTQVWPPERQSQAVSEVDRRQHRKSRRDSLPRFFARAGEFWRRRYATCTSAVFTRSCSLCNAPRTSRSGCCAALFPVTLCQRAGKAIVERVAAPPPCPPPPPATNPEPPHSLTLNSLSLQAHKTRWHRRRFLECRCVYVGPAPPGRTLALCLRGFRGQPMCLPDAVCSAPAEYRQALMCNQEAVQGRVLCRQSACRKKENVISSERKNKVLSCI